MNDCSVMSNVNLQVDSKKKQEKYGTKEFPSKNLVYLTKNKMFENISSIYLIKETSLVFFHAIVIYFPQAEQYWVELITLFIK